MSYRMTDIIKTEFVAVVMVFLAGVLLPYSGFAGESEPHRHHGVGARLSYANFSTATIGDVDLDMVFDDTVFPEINYTYVLRKHFFLELSASYIKTDVDLEFADQSGNIGEFTQIPVILTLNYNKKINLTDIFFNAGIGAGCARPDFRSRTAPHLGSVRFERDPNPHGEWELARHVTRAWSSPRGIHPSPV